MGHAEHDLLQAERAAALDDLLQRRDERLAAIQSETFGALVLDVDELLEAFGLDQLLQNRLLALGGEGDLLVGALYARLDPGLLLGIGDVHELDTERRAVGPRQNVEHLGYGRVFESEYAIDEYFAAVVRLGE